MANPGLLAAWQGRAGRAAEGVSCWVSIAMDGESLATFANWYTDCTLFGQVHTEGNVYVNAPFSVGF